MKNIILLFAIILTFCDINAQVNRLNLVSIQQNSLKFKWAGYENADITLHYGLTPSLEMGTVSNPECEIKNLKDATFYYVQGTANINGIQEETVQELFSTSSSSPGKITVYFNQPVDNSISATADAIYISNLEDTLVAYINRVNYTLDVCNYNTGSLLIVNAINAARNRGVIVRYIASKTELGNNDYLDNLSSAIPMIQRPDNDGVMHNKFMIIDASYPQISKIITGSLNHKYSSIFEDYNNLVILEDMSLALAYKLEFEEMWGSTSITPNIANAKFGNKKTDNTPHEFNIGGKYVQLYFSPSDKTTSKIESAILSAQTDMEFAMLTFINNDLGDAVINIHNSSVNVKGIIENIYYIGSEYLGLINAGVDVKSHFTVSNLLHHKFAVVDATNISSNPLTITGSHNWTNSAEEDYDENTLIIHDAVVANMYYEEFMTRYNGFFSGVNKINTNEIKVSPNPSTSHLYIESKYDIVSVKIYNASGQFIMNIDNGNTNNCIIDVSTWQSDAYYTLIETSAGKSIKRVIVRAN
ncbi:MAG: phospholipase D-like domain-containing protein [Saprospiraceae bacterium]